MTASEKDPLVSSEAGYGGTTTPDDDKEEIVLAPLYQRVKETMSLFWYLGAIAFGGPTAHVAILRDHLVSVNNFIDDDVFTELFSLGTSLLITLSNIQNTAQKIEETRKILIFDNAIFFCYTFYYI